MPRLAKDPPGMTRKVRIRVLGDGWELYGDDWQSYGDGTGRIPPGTEIVFTEAEAAAFLKDRGSRNSAEVVETFDDADVASRPAGRANPSRRTRS
jgi:hypothetical protein